MFCMVQRLSVHNGLDAKVGSVGAVLSEQQPGKRVHGGGLAGAVGAINVVIAAVAKVEIRFPDAFEVDKLHR